MIDFCLVEWFYYRLMLASINSLQHHIHRRLLREQLMALFIPSGEVSFASELKLAIFNKLLDFIFVAVFLAIDVKISPHGGDKVPTSLQTAVDVI